MTSFILRSVGVRSRQVREGMMPMPVLPDSRPFRYLPEVDPTLADKALANLSAPARLVWLYTAVRPIGTLVSRTDLASAIDTDPAGHLEQTLGELVDGGWLRPEPPDCSSDGGFRLAVDLPAPEAEPMPAGLLLPGGPAESAQAWATKTRGRLLSAR